MRNLLVNAGTAAIALLLAGCANGYQQFYRPANGVDAARIAALRAGPPPQTPTVERASPTANRQELVDAYAKRGYVLIGSASFNSGQVQSEAAAVEQARAVGADLVVIHDPRYTGSVTTAVPITVPTTSTSYSSGSATAYGPGGTTTAFGTGTTTTYGSSTSYVPMTIHRSDYAAAFFVKERFALGLFFRDLSDAERQDLQTNRGAAVRLVVDGTPAFNADILVGDIVTNVDGVPVTDSRSMTASLAERRGQRVTFGILRRGQTLEKVVQLNP